MIGKFIKKGENGVWENVIENNSFSKEDVLKVQKDFTEYINDRNTNYDDEYERIRFHRMNKAGEISPLWRKWGAYSNVKTAIDFDYCGSLEAQRNNCYDKSKTIRDTEEQTFAGALMCCDTPSRTISFLWATFCDVHKIGLGERLAVLPKLSQYVNLQMELAFIRKWTGKVGRPSDYEFLKGYKKSLSIIPHPNHPSDDSGHSTVGQAVKKFTSTNYENVRPEFSELCDDVGTARVTVGIHWFTDHESAVRNVERYHDLTLKYMN